MDGGVLDGAVLRVQVSRCATGAPTLAQVLTPAADLRTPPPSPASANTTALALALALPVAGAPPPPLPVALPVAGARRIRVQLPPWALPLALAEPQQVPVPAAAAEEARSKPSVRPRRSCGRMGSRRACVRSRRWRRSLRRRRTWWRPRRVQRLLWPVPLALTAWWWWWWWVPWWRCWTAQEPRLRREAHAPATPREGAVAELLAQPAAEAAQPE